jgi:hypothetical protein
MKSIENYAQQFKRKGFKCALKNLRKKMHCIVLIASDFKSIGLTIYINEKLLGEYSNINGRI